jgi:hypothetical protein
VPPASRVVAAFVKCRFELLFMSFHVFKILTFQTPMFLQRIGGCTIQCSESSCTSSFHISCAADLGCMLRLKEGTNLQVTYCIDHTKARLHRKRKDTTNEWQCTSCGVHNRIPASAAHGAASGPKASTVENTFKVYTKAIDKLGGLETTNDIQKAHEVFVLKSRGILSLLLLHNDCTKTISKKLKIIHEKIGKGMNHGFK